MKKILLIIAVMVLFLNEAGAKKITIVIDMPDDTETIAKKVKEFPLIFNSQVEKWLVYYVTAARDYFDRKLRESGKYVGMMKRIFSEYELPEGLVYLALVESGFNPYAYSSAHAVGVWQFIKSTGKLYGLNNDGWLDERRNVEKSTNAAAKTLKDLFSEFGTWPLAIAAYNCGSYRVRQAIKDQGTTDFWALVLPAETMAFVPKVIAAIMIASNPQDYGFSGEMEPAHKFDIVKTAGCVDFNVIAKCCYASLEQITILNPELTNQCTPDQKNEYDLKIPYGTKEMFLQNFEKLSDREKYLSQEEISRRKGGWVVYTVKKGDTLGGIAKKFKTTVANIKKCNPCARGKYIQVGDKLRVFKKS